MIGGADADVFLFANIRESGTTKATRDVIADLQSGEDTIDLGAMDADSTCRGNQAFTFIGGDAFSGLAGQLRFRAGIVSGDVDGDRVADFQIAASGVTALMASDFIL